MIKLDASVVGTQNKESDEVVCGLVHVRRLRINRAPGEPLTLRIHILNRLISCMPVL